jgi:hypothetical protein
MWDFERNEAQKAPQLKIGNSSHSCSSIGSSYLARDLLALAAWDEIQCHGTGKALLCRS